MDPIDAADLAIDLSCFEGKQSPAAVEGLREEEQREEEAKTAEDPVESPTVAGGGDGMDPGSGQQIEMDMGSPTPFGGPKRLPIDSMNAARKTLSPPE